MVKSRWLSVFAVILFFTLLSGDTLRYGLSWYGWGAVVLAIFVVSIVLIVRRRRLWQFSSLPVPMVAFAILTVLSIAWSDYRQWTAAGALGTVAAMAGALALAVTFPLRRLVVLLGHALRIVLAASILFELVVSIFVRHPFTPWWTHYAVIHPADYWSRDLLFKGGRVQGIMGNSDLLGFIALLGVIVFGIELASRAINRVVAAASIVVALIDMALTRSATVIVAAVIVTVVAIILVLVRRAPTPRARRSTWIVSVVVVVIGIVGAIALHSQILRLLNKSSTLTGRTGIWSEVISIASERPVAGWGWISYWLPNLSPFDKKAFNIGGVQYLQAHDAWLDLYLQLGVIGVVIFGWFAISTLVRAWTTAIDRPQFAAGASASYDPMTLAPVLILVALLAQSIAESRLLIEYGILLLSLIAIVTKRMDVDEPSSIPRPFAVAATPER